MLTTRKNNRVAKVIANEVKGENTMNTNAKRNANATATMKGETAMTLAKEIVKKNIAIATANETKGENTMDMTANFNTNTALNGYEIRFSVAPDEKFRDRLGKAKKGEDKRKKHYNFKFYQYLNNAWIIKQDKITEKSLTALKKEIKSLGFEIIETVDGSAPKAKKPVAKKATAKPVTEVKTAKIPKGEEADLVSYLRGLGYVIELPEQKPEVKEEPKAKKPATKKATAKKSEAKKPVTKKATEAKAETPKKKATPKAKKSSSKKEEVVVVNAEMPF